MKRGAKSEERGAIKLARSVALRSSLLALLVVVVWPAIANACPVCWGESDSPQAKGMNNAIWAMLGLIGFVQMGFVALFFGFWKRAREIRKRKEQFHLIRGMRHEP